MPQRLVHKSYSTVSSLEASSVALALSSPLRMPKHSAAVFALISSFSILSSAFRNPANLSSPSRPYDYRGYHPSRQGSGHFGSLNNSIIPWAPLAAPLEDTPILSSEAEDCTTHTYGDSPSTFWLEMIAHQGTSPFLQDSADYVVFRNVKDFGAKGDGSTDDSAAINAAIISTLISS